MGSSVAHANSFWSLSNVTWRTCEHGRCPENINASEFENGKGRGKESKITPSISLVYDTT